MRGGNFAFQRGRGKISLMQRAKVIMKQPPMLPVNMAAGGSSIEFGRRGNREESHAVQGAGRMRLRNGKEEI